MELLLAYLQGNWWTILAFIWPLVLPNTLVHAIGLRLGQAFRVLLGQRKVWTYFRGSLYALIQGLERGIEDKPQ